MAQGQYVCPNCQGEDCPVCGGCRCPDELCTGPHENDGGPLLGIGAAYEAVAQARGDAEPPPTSYGYA